MHMILVFCLFCYFMLKTAVCFVSIHRMEQMYQNVMSLWHQLHVNMKSVVSWHYLQKDTQNISSWSLDKVRNTNPNQFPIILLLEYLYRFVFIILFYCRCACRPQRRGSKLWTTWTPTFPTS